MVLKDSGGNSSETKGVLNVELAAKQFQPHILSLMKRDHIACCWKRLDTCKLLHTFNNASKFDSMARRPGRNRASR